MWAPRVRQPTLPHNCMLVVQQPAARCAPTATTPTSPTARRAAPTWSAGAGGSCMSCTAGQACQPSEPVQERRMTSCTTGVQTCVETTNKTASTLCGAGQSCAAGVLYAAGDVHAGGHVRGDAHELPRPERRVQPVPRALDCSTCPAGQMSCPTGCKDLQRRRAQLRLVRHCLPGARGWRPASRHAPAGSAAFRATRVTSACVPDRRRQRCALRAVPGVGLRGPERRRHQADGGPVGDPRRWASPPAWCTAAWLFAGACPGRRDGDGMMTSSSVADSEGCCAAGRASCQRGS